jgi:S-adenosyl methyltransferase
MEPDFDTSVAHSARVHDYWLGGTDNLAADRAAGDAVIQAYPGIVASVRANRAFLARVVSFLAAEAGIRQFPDLGTGIPTANNTHQVAQATAPGCTAPTPRWPASSADWSSSSPASCRSSAGGPYRRRRPGPVRPCGEEWPANLPARILPRPAAGLPPPSSP